MVAEHCLLRKPLQRASDDALEIPHLGGTIQIHHPGYPKGETLLLALSGYDDLEGSISFDVALTACAILACNRFDGWISRESTADAPKLIGISLLSPGDYWFHVLAPDGISTFARELKIWSADDVDRSTTANVPIPNRAKFPELVLPSRCPPVMADASS